MEIKKEKTSGHDLVWAQMRYCPYWPARVCTKSILLQTLLNYLILLYTGSGNATNVGTSTDKKNMRFIFWYETIVS